MQRFVLFFSLLLLISCNKFKKDSAKDREKKIPLVVTETLSLKQVQDHIVYPAQVEAGSNVVVMSEVEGFVRSVHVSLGTQVEKGRTLFTVENPDPVYKYAPSEVTAPVSGVVSAIDVTVGTRLERGKKMAQVSDVRNLKVMMEVIAQDIHHFKPGTVAEFKVADQSQKIKVKGVSPVIDLSTGTAAVEWVFVGPHQFLPGSLGQVELATKTRTMMQVPDSAVVYRGSESFLRIVKDQKASWKTVKMGTSLGGLTEITSGVSVGDVYVAKTSLYVGDGDQVEIQAQKKEEVARP